MKKKASRIWLPKNFVHAQWPRVIILTASRYPMCHYYWLPSLRALLAVQMVRLFSTRCRFFSPTQDTKVQNQPTTSDVVALQGCGILFFFFSFSVHWRGRGILRFSTLHLRKHNNHANTKLLFQWGPAGDKLTKVRKNHPSPTVCLHQTDVQQNQSTRAKEMPF